MLIAGVDEAGRGPLAGPVVAAAVILDPNNLITGLKDSKKLSEKKREYLYEEIINKALAYAIAEASVEEIDSINILQASLLAMQRAVMQLVLAPDKVLVDGNQCPQLLYPTEALIQGDALEPCISAASILAKVHRDRLLHQLDLQYPQYGFAKHKAYPTKEHITALKIYGVSPVHRRSYAPVRELLEMQVSVDDAW